MSAKKILSLLLPIFLLVSATAHSQIITTKKEALKKGVYEKPEEKKAGIAAAAEKPKQVIKTVQKPAKKKLAVVEEEQPDLIVSSPSESYLSLQLINNAMEFLGVRYRGGGTTTKGMDCSGMVTAVFNLFDIKLPRSSNAMAHVGEKVEGDDIKKGDLIFFKTNGRSVINHVGVVIEKIGDEIKFIHSSTSKGVMVSSTGEPYYKRTFAQVNRIIQQ
ncbi:MAG TPA: C40 family peptidase [Flavobacterium sp.]|nr:C40 family peptidase [Flavobacterium sp.]